MAGSKDTAQNSFYIGYDYLINLHTLIVNALLDCNELAKNFQIQLIYTDQNLVDKYDKLKTNRQMMFYYDFQEYTTQEVNNYKTYCYDKI